MKKVNKTVNYFGAVISITWKDLLAEIRSRELFAAMFVFSLLVILIFNFALELEPDLRLVVTPGVLWVTFIFSGTLGINRSMAIEKEKDCLDGLLLAPIDRSAIYFGKMLSTLVIMLGVEIITLPVYSILYNLNLFQPGFLMVILLGSIGFAAVGTLLSSMTIQTRMRDLLLPILLFPVSVPVLLSAVKASTGYMQGLEPIQIAPWLNLLLSYDVIFLAVAFMFFDSIIEE